MSQKALLIPSLLAGLAMFFGIAALAGELPKEGTYSATYAGYGTCQITAVGKERLLSVCDENALMTADGFLDHTTWHCWAFADFVKGMGAPHGSFPIRNVPRTQLTRYAPFAHRSAMHNNHDAT